MLEQIIARYLAETQQEQFFNWLQNNHHQLHLSDGAVYPPVNIGRKNKLLWVMNVCWLGGTALWVLDAIRSLGEHWDHHVIYLNAGEEPEVAEQFKKLGVNLSKSTRISKKLVESIDPSNIILSNPDPNRIEGEHPWNWITSKYNVVYVHHTAVRPWLPNAQADVFVSNGVKKQYSNLTDRMKMVITVPPGIDTKSYSSIKRPQDNGRCVIGRLSSDNPDKFPTELIGILNDVGCAAEIVGGDKYYSDVDNPNFSFPKFGSMTPIEFYKRWDIFVYRTNLTETWGRTISEAMAAGLPIVVENRGGPAEQIEHGHNGFLCNNDEDFCKYLRILVDDPSLRLQMGLNARIKAQQEFDASRFNDHVGPILTANAI